MARKQRDEGGGYSWMDTYGDMVTLLLTFFILLFSMSTVEEDKWEKLILAFTKNPGNETSQVVLTPDGEGTELGTNQAAQAIANEGGGDSVETDNVLPQSFDDLYDYLKTYVEENNLSGSVSVSKENGRVYVRFDDNIFFNPDSDVLKPESFDILNFMGEGFAAVQEEILAININGHTAAIPNFEDYPVSDRRLSSERASSVAIYFEEQKHIDPQKLLAIGYGKNFPVESNDTPEGQAKNRRVDMIILSNEQSMGNNDMLYTLLTGSFDSDIYPKTGDGGDVLIPQTDGGAEGTGEAPSEPAAPDASTQPPAPQEGDVPPQGEADAPIGPAAPGSGEASAPAEPPASSGASASFGAASEGVETNESGDTVYKGVSPFA